MIRRFLMVCLFAIATSSISRAQSSLELAQQEQAAFQAATRVVEKSVVQLRVIGAPTRVGGQRVAPGPATGTIVSSQGHVVTSQYRFSPLPANVLAQLPDGSQYSAKIVATDFSRKLVLLKLQQASNLPEPKFADPDATRVGQWTVAVGRTFRLDRVNVSIGILSAKNRLFGRALQTDAKISAANYGGPLIDVHGRVLGILSPMSPGSESSIAGTEWYDSGIGFAIPLKPWIPMIERMEAEGDLYPGRLGVVFEQTENSAEMPTIKQVAPDGPAQKAGLQPGDLITSIDGTDVDSFKDLRFAIVPRYAGDSLTIGYVRDGKTEECQVTLARASEIKAVKKTPTRASAQEEKRSAP